MSERIRVLRIITRLIVGGPTHQVVALTEQLDPTRFQSTLVVGGAGLGEQSLLEWARARGLAPLELPEMVGELSIKPRDCRTVSALVRLMRRERPHIVHTHTAKAGAIGRLAAWLAGVPIVVHTYHGHCLHGYYSAPVNQGLRAMERWLAGRTHCLVAVSGRIRDDLVHYRVTEPGKIAVVPLGVSLEPFLASRGVRGEFRYELGVGIERRLVGIVGRLSEIKNHDLFLRAVARLTERDGRILGVVVGDGPLLGQMRLLARDLGLGEKVVFTGWRMDLPRIYADLDVLVVSSRNEGTPVSIIEAMAAGCPVVATSVGGIPDMVTHGETGRLVGSGDEAALAQAVLDTVTDRDGAQRQAARARDRARERYGVARLVKDIDALYSRLLGARGLA